MNNTEIKPNVVIIVQARVSSTRLPNKVMKHIGGKPILFHVLDRLKYVKNADKIVVATTTEPDDDAIEKFCLENQIALYRGSLLNVLERFYKTAKLYKADIIIRITSDCPLIDPTIVDDMLAVFLREYTKSKIDYLSNTIHRTLPRGLDVEIFSFETLKKTYKDAILEFELEHVTPYIYSHPELFTVRNYSFPYDFSYHRWTVDTQEDFKLITEIFNSFSQRDNIFLLNDILELFSKRPDLIKINQHIRQKTIGD